MPTLAQILMQAAGPMVEGLAMTGAELISTTLFTPKAVVYVRQSTRSQVMTNMESQRR